MLSRAYRQPGLARFGAFDAASAATIVALLGLVLLTFRDYSISNDEYVQHRYGELILAYYGSGFADQGLFNFTNLYLYGGLFDVVAILLGYVLPGDIYAIRHLLCGVIGVGGIAAAWGTARTIAGPRAGFLAALALAVCGVWYGAMFNHTKDVPFAAAMIGASCFLLRAVRDLPRPRHRDLMLFGLMFGAALGQRALGLFIVAYIPIAIALQAPPPLAPAAAMRFAGRALLSFMPALALAYLIMIAAWPWSALSPLNPLRAVFAFSHFQYPIRTLLFGSTYLMAEVPRSYVPVYLAIKLPLILLFGAALALFVIASADRTRDRRLIRETIFIAVTAALPVLLHVATHGPAFSGMRHFTFIVPPLAVLAGIGFDRAVTALEARSHALATLMLGVVGASFVWTASVLVRLHPYEHLYFNESVGGLAGANQRFDTDYWVNVMHEAVTGLEQVLDREKRPHVPYNVAACSEATQFGRDAAARQDLQLATGPTRADFFIAPTHMHCDGALDGKVIVKIERMGAVIGVVKDRRPQPKDVAQAR